MEKKKKHFVSGRGNFAVLWGAKKSFFSGVLIGPKSLYCFTLIACNFDIYAAHRRSLLQHAAVEDAARAAVRESSDTVHSREAQRQAAPDNPETTGTYHRRGRRCADEK